jgi:transcription initiation factor TFIIIB Brf1 subunit/transcription initiation factor TFIIB
MRLIRDMASKLNLKEPAYNKACEIYKEIEDLGIKGVSINAKVATVVFIASRIERQPRGVKEIL